MSDVWYDAENGLPLLHEGGDYRVLGLLPPSEAVSAPPPDFVSARKVFPRSEWRDISLRHYGVPIMDQKQSSACGGFATCAAFSVGWYASGQPQYRFSPFWIYGLCNHGRDAGLVLSDALAALIEHGVAREEAVPSGAMFRSQFPTTAFSDARCHKVMAWKLSSFDELGSALAQGLTVVSGIMVGQNLGKLDSEGVCPLPDRIVGGHAMAHLGIKRSNRHGWLIETQNSWSSRWGMGGYCYLHEGHFAGRVDAFAVGIGLDSVADRTTDPPPVAAV